MLLWRNGERTCLPSRRSGFESLEQHQLTGRLGMSEPNAL